MIANLLADLVGFPSVVGTPNHPIVDFVVAHFAAYGVEAIRIPGPEGDRTNLFATIGPADRPGYVLSGHLDVVPANEPQWRGDPFRLRREGDRLVGRGACDMKGFVAAMLSVVPDLCRRRLAVPIHFALSYDEEAGGRGAPHMLAALPNLCARPLGCVVGEPSDLVPVLRHKGKMAIRAVAQGISGHSSRPDLGLNAIHMLLPVFAAAVAAAEDLKGGPLDHAFAPPWSSLQIGVMRGGEAVNIIPERASLDIEARAIAGVEPADLLARIREAAPEGVEVEVLSSYPPLAMSECDAMAGLMERVSGRKPLAAVSYGTEAGLFQKAGIPTVICGPGDISRAHKPEEHITLGELDAARAMILALVEAVAGPDTPSHPPRSAHRDADLRPRAPEATMSEKPLPTVTLEPLASSHLDAAHALSRAAGWPHRREDWANLLAVSSGVAAIADGEVVGTGICSVFEGRARLNMIIVSERMRSRGLGRRIIDALIALGGDLPLSLTATEDGFPLYRKLGFEPANAVSQYQGLVRAPGELGPDTVRPATQDDMPAIVATDSRATGAGRARLLHALADRGRMFVAEGGFACLVPFGRGKVLGPLAAADLATARSLVAHALRDCEGQFVRVDTDPALGLVPALTALGLASVGDGTVMHRGAPPPAADVSAYALASQALG